jgi:hypothetical protein
LRAESTAGRLLSNGFGSTEERLPMQVPAPFEYERATSVQQALELLQARGPEARLLAGGHSLCR